MTSLAALSSFLAGYLHQDWDLEYEDPSDAAMEFGSSAPVELVLRVLGELAMLNAAALDDVTMESVMTDAGCYFRPTQSSLRDWLTGLERVIGAALWARRA